LDDENLARLISGNDGGTSRLKELLAERRQKLAHRKTLEDERSDGLLEKDEFYRMRNRVVAAIERLDEEITEARHQHLQLPVTAGQSIEEAYDSSPDGWRRMLLERVTKGIEVKPSHRKPRFMLRDGTTVIFDQERVVIDWRELSNADLYEIAALINEGLAATHRDSVAQKVPARKRRSQVFDTIVVRDEQPFQLALAA
jgi:hypothetical protein